MVLKRTFLPILFAMILGHHRSVKAGHHGLHREKRDTTLANCLDKYEAISGHTMCLANVTQHPVDSSDQQSIVNKHNQIRGSVKPEAANMLKMYYDKTLETEAQLWAEHCKLTHESSYKRFLPGRYPVGQNIVTSTKAETWEAVIDLWANEKSSFTYGGPGNIFKKVGHYTQLVWATSSLVGCGMTKCDGTFFYVCNYGPSGNINTINTPYIRLSNVNGQHCTPKTLCDCHGKVCFNGGSLDPLTCECKCNTKLKIYNNSLCELQCLKDGDNSLCGRRPFNKGSCSSNTAAATNCPWLCDICPYADKNYVEDSVALPSSSTIAVTSWIPVVLLTSSIKLLCL